MRIALLRVYHILEKSYGPQYWWPADTRFEMIVGAFLTQNTSWTNVEKAIARLKQKKYLSMSQMMGLSKQRLAMTIRSAGSFNVKANRIKNFLSHLHLQYNGRLELLLGLPLEALRQE